MRMRTGLALLGLGLTLGWATALAVFVAQPSQKPELTRVRHLDAPLTQWKCDAQEVKEYENACVSRIRMGKVRKWL